MSDPGDEQVASFERAQAAARRRRVVVALAVAVGVGVALVAGFRWASPTPCESLAAQLCAMAGMPECGTLRGRLAQADAAKCQATIELLESTSDRATRMSLATRAIADLMPETAEFNRAVLALPVERRKQFLEKVQAASEEERRRLVRQLVETGDF